MIDKFSERLGEKADRSFFIPKRLTHEAHPTPGPAGIHLCEPSEVWRRRLIERELLRLEHARDAVDNEIARLRCLQSRRVS